MTLTHAIGYGCSKVIRLIVRALALSRIHPNVLTFRGLVINIAAAYLLAGPTRQGRREPTGRNGEPAAGGSGPAAGGGEAATAPPGTAGTGAGADRPVRSG